MNSNHKGDKNPDQRSMGRDGQSVSRQASGSESGNRSQQGHSRSGSQGDMSQSDRSWNSQGGKSSRSDESNR